jgi:hypothetical protein
MAAYLREYRRFVGDDRRRREWLWLRAREKEDDTSLALLARADPDLPARMRAIDDELGKIAARAARGLRPRAGRTLARGAGGRLRLRVVRCRSVVVTEGAWHHLDVSSVEALARARGPQPALAGRAFGCSS